MDTLAVFAGLKGDAVNNAVDALAAMDPLKVAAQQHELSVEIVRHDRKGGGAVGESGRGSSAFTGEVDISLSIRRAEANQPTRRKLEARRRFDETPEELLIELTATGYKALDEYCQVHAHSSLMRP